MTPRVILAKHEGGHLPVLVDDDQYEALSRHSWRVNAGGYAIRTSYDTVLMHRQILGVHGGPEIIDHINMDKLDNRSSNLRLCTRQQNNCNSPPRRSSKTGLKGVIHLPTLKKKPYRACLQAHGVSHFLGYHATAQQAADAYDQAALLHHGAFARLNRSIP